MVPKVLLVGGGITTAMVTRLLQLEFDKINITIWEKMSQIGGRFNTVYDSKKNDSVELGAQYITTTNDKLKNNEDNIYPNLLRQKLIKIMNHRIKGMKQPQSNVTNFVAPSGMTSLVTHFLNVHQFKVCYFHKLIALYILNDKWCAFSESGTEEMFDAVILTIPVPEILKLCGSIKSLLSENKPLFNSLNAVRYSSRYALALFFEFGVPTEYDSEYINDDSVLRFVSYDSWKRRGENIFFCAAFHTTIQFGEEHRSSDSEVVKEIILKHIYKKFPQLPKPSIVTFHHWDYSQVLCPYESKPGAVIISEKPLLIAGGDGFIGSTFDQCAISAKNVVSKMISTFVVAESVRNVPK